MTENSVSEFIPSEAYLAREKRIFDAFNVRKPDRVPVAPLVVTYYATKQEGILNKDVHYDFDLLYKAYERAAFEYNWDCAPPSGVLPDGKLIDLMGMTQIRLPGRGVGDDLSFQFVDGQYMFANEYDEMLADPNGFAIKKLWPRVSSTLAPISNVVNLLPTMHLASISNAYMVSGVLLNLFATPEMLDTLKKLPLAVEQTMKTLQVNAAYTQRMAELGFPTIFTAFAETGYDFFSDFLRGLRGVMLDLYRDPERLLETINIFSKISIETAIMQAKMAGSKGVFIPLHRGSAGFMSNEQYEKFYWPTFKDLVLALIEADLVPIPLLEGDYTPRLEFLQELPAKKWVAHWDIVDRKKVKDMLGDKVCYWGNVPAGLMCTGTPEQVTADVREMIDMFGESGGLLIDASMGIPDESRPENVRALTEAVEKYGV